MNLALELGPRVQKDLESDESLAPLKREDLHHVNLDYIPVRFGN